MVRRPLHLRWIYVKTHPWLFVLLIVLLIGVLVASMTLVDDPTRGLILGAVPVAFAVSVWGFTNNATYPDRRPGGTIAPLLKSDPSEANRRNAPAPASPSASVRATDDPFALPQPMATANLASQSAEKRTHSKRTRRSRTPAQSEDTSNPA